MFLAHQPVEHRQSLRRSSTSNQQIEQIYHETSNSSVSAPIVVSDATSQDASNQKSKLPIAESVYIKAAAAYQSQYDGEGNNSLLVSFPPSLPPSLTPSLTHSLSSNK